MCLCLKVIRVLDKAKGSWKWEVREGEGCRLNGGLNGRPVGFMESPDLKEVREWSVQVFGGRQSYGGRGQRQGSLCPAPSGVTSRLAWLEPSDPSERRHEASKESWARGWSWITCLGGLMHRP